MQKKPTLRIKLDIRSVKKSGLYPVKLRVTFKKDQRYYVVGIDLSKDDFELMPTIDNVGKSINIKRKRALQESKIICDGFIVLANQAINKMTSFSFRVFEKRFLSNQHTTESVFVYYDNIIHQLRKDGRIGTASNYNTSMNSLKKFSARLMLREVTVDFLKEYEKSLKAERKSETTVGIYLRPLRAIINQAIEEDSFPREEYPFGKRRYQIPASRNLKKALTLEEMGRLVMYSAIPDSWWEKAKDFFVFSYFANGINIKDILRLKYQDIDGEYIHFIRAKTERTNRMKSSVISIHMGDEINSIIKRWGNKDNRPSSFLFPILNYEMNPERERATSQQFTKMVNTYLKLIVSELGIDKPVTTYYARHTFATVLKRNGVSVLFIGESLGHSSIKTTENYLDSFEDEQRKVTLEQLRNFKQAS